MADSIVPGVLAADERLAPMAELTQRLSLLPVDGLLVDLVDMVSAPFLPHLAEQFRVLGLGDWSGLAEADQRELVRNAIRWHRKKGTAWAVKELCRRLGYEVKIIPQHAARKMWTDSGGATLDGRPLSGWPLVSWSGVTGVPYLSHWAEFGVRVDLASAARPGWNEEVRQAVGAAKPVRSWPVFCYVLALDLSINVTAISALAMRKRIDVDYPWCNLRLDGGWSVGADDRSLTLSGTPLDGSWRIGQVTPGTSMAVIRQCNIISSGSVTKAIVRPDQNILCRLGERLLRLDGGWDVGHNRVLALGSGRMQSTIAVTLTPATATAYAYSAEMAYPATPARLARRPRLHRQEKLDGRWGVGTPRPPVRRMLDGSWAIRRTGIGTASSATVRLHGQCTASPRKLAGPWERVGRGWSRRLDGTWSVGARFNLDGHWALTRGHYLGAPKVGTVYPTLNGTWPLGYTYRLDDAWTVGQAGPACDITIKSYNI